MLPIWRPFWIYTKKQTETRKELKKSLTRCQHQKPPSDHPHKPCFTKEKKKTNLKSMHDRSEVIKLLIGGELMLYFHQTHDIFYFFNSFIIYLLPWECGLLESRDFCLFCSLVLPQPSKCTWHLEGTCSLFVTESIVSNPVHFLLTRYNFEKSNSKWNWHFKQPRRWK